MTRDPTKEEHERAAWVLSTLLYSGGSPSLKDGSWEAAERAGEDLACRVGALGFAIVPLGEPKPAHGGPEYKSPCGLRGEVLAVDGGCATTTIGHDYTKGMDLRRMTKKGPRL